MNVRLPSFPWISPLLLAGVFFLYPIPHTIALRNLLLLICLVFSLAFLLRSRGRWPTGRQGWQSICIVLGLLTLWMPFESVVFGLDPSASLQGFRGDWLVMLLAVATSVMVWRKAEIQTGEVPGVVVSSKYQVLTFLVAVLVLHLCWYLVYRQVWGVGRPMPGDATPFGGRDFHSTLMTYLATLLIAEVLARRLLNYGFLPWPVWLSWGLLSLSLVGTYLLSTRNGSVVVLMEIALACAVYWRVNSRPISCRAIVVMVLGLFLGLGALLHDERWPRFVESVSIAQDVDGHRFWLSSRQEEYPKMSNGQPVDHSAYMRMAWATVAVQELHRYPFGVGYGHQAFGRAVNASYKVNTGIQSSHSGLLDLALATGWPGLMLYLALTFLMVRYGWRAAMDGEAAGYALVLFVVGNLARVAVDGHLSGWRLESYAMITAVLVCMSYRQTEVKP